MLRARFFGLLWEELMGVMGTDGSGWELWELMGAMGEHS